SDDTVELPARTPGAGADQSFSASARVEVAGLSHPGRVRPNNQDHFLICRFSRSLETLQTNVPEEEIPKRVDEIGYGILVADGVGGGAAGEVASKLAIRRASPLTIAVAVDPHGSGRAKDAPLNLGRCRLIWLCNRPI